MLENESIKARTIFYYDIDDTLFYHRVPINTRVLNAEGELIKSLSTEEFASYEKKAGEFYDYSDFTSTERFIQHSVPILRMIWDLNFYVQSGIRVELLTARSDMDEPQRFLEYLRKCGIPKEVHVRRAGNLTTGSAATAKKQVVRDAIIAHGYRHVQLFDDSKANLAAVASLQEEFPMVSLIVNHVQYNKERDYVTINSWVA